MKRVATVGTFDGVHRGHHCVLETLRSYAGTHAMTPLVVTFRNHPLSVIAPERAPGSLCSPEEKEAMLRQEGMEVDMETFTPDMCALSAKEWIRRLRDNHNVRAIVIGYDNTFGCDGRTMKREDYIKAGKDEGVDIVVAPEIDGISSSAVRKAVEAGNLEKAAEMLGRFYTLRGKVVRGKQLGRTIGIPTANLLPENADAVLPPFGAYISEVRLPDMPPFRGVTNIGVRPTVDNATLPAISIETYILDFDADIYDAEIEVSLLHFLRREEKFSSLSDLKRQIEKDILCARRYRPLPPPLPISANELSLRRFSKQ